jgi:hypothetical protein
MGKRRDRGSIPRFVGLRYWLLDSPAWLSLPCNARALYVQIAKRYNGANNGRISYSVREAYKELKISKSTAFRAFRVLQHRGFIVCTKKGAFSWKVVNEASEWRLTEYANDCPPEHATKEFLRYRAPEPDSNEPLKFRTRVPRRNHMGTQAERHGYPSGTTNAKKGLRRYSGETTNAQNDAFVGTEAGHLQLPGMSPEGGERSAPAGSAVASEPPDWKALGYPPGGPSREEHLAALERTAQERGPLRPPRRAGGRS